MTSSSDHWRAKQASSHHNQQDAQDDQQRSPQRGHWYPSNPAACCSTNQSVQADSTVDAGTFLWSLAKGTHCYPITEAEFLWFSRTLQLHLRTLFIGRVFLDAKSFLKVWPILSYLLLIHQHRFTYRLRRLFTDDENLKLLTLFLRIQRTATACTAI